MTQCVKANSQRVIFTKTGVVTTKRVVDDHSPFSVRGIKVAYHTVTWYLDEPARGPQRLTLTSGQSNIGKKFISISMMDLTRKKALELANSKSFEAAFDLADNRKSVETGCEKAKLFYNEHILYNNPFPPKQKFAVVLGESKRVAVKKEAESRPKSEDDVITARSTSSGISLLEGTMSLTSMSSHSQLSATTPSHPVNLKTPKKNRFRQHPPDSQMKRAGGGTVPPPKTPKAKSPKRFSPPTTSTDENRLINTFNTSE
uniref:PID domain-containing protein n=1 Tax=Caenorhabditis tropicalis TaxID=1561998 RepID=A0A1I7V133_9PELO